MKNTFQGSGKRNKDKKFIQNEKYNFITPKVVMRLRGAIITLQRKFCLFNNNRSPDMYQIPAIYHIYDSENKRTPLPVYDKKFPLLSRLLLRSIKGINFLPMKMKII